MDAGWVRMAAHVRGRVQGVGFRAFVQRQARQLNCRGRVANSADSQAVVVIAEGDRPSLERLVGALQRGPRLAHVTDVQVEWTPATGEFDDFVIQD